MKSKAQHPTSRHPRPTWLGVALAALFGCVPAFLAGWAIKAGRIAYTTGHTERHEVLATPESSPVIYWTLVVVFCLAAVALWAKGIIDLIQLKRSDHSGR